MTFIHGFGGAPDHWNDLRAKLPLSLRDSALTLPGHATRATESGVFSIEAAAQEILEQHLFNPTVLVGHSMGVRTATEAAFQA